MVKIFKVSEMHIKPEFKEILVSVEHLITLLTSHCFQIPLTPRMFPVWDFVVRVFARKAMLNMGWVITIFNCQYLYSK